MKSLQVKIFFGGFSNTQYIIQCHYLLLTGGRQEFGMGGLVCITFSMMGGCVSLIGFAGIRGRCTCILKQKISFHLVSIYVLNKMIMLIDIVNYCLLRILLPVQEGAQVREEGVQQPCQLEENLLLKKVEIDHPHCSRLKLHNDG